MRKILQIYTKKDMFQAMKGCQILQGRFNVMLSSSVHFYNCCHVKKIQFSSNIIKSCLHHVHLLHIYQLWGKMFNCTKFGW